jgi:hypothetical protein
MSLNNVRIYDPQASSEIFLNLNHYRDTGHCNAQISRRILEYIRDKDFVNSVAEVETNSALIERTTRAYRVGEEHSRCLQ